MGEIDPLERFVGSDTSAGRNVLSLSNGPVHALCPIGDDSPFTEPRAKIDKLIACSGPEVIQVAGAGEP